MKGHILFKTLYDDFFKIFDHKTKEQKGIFYIL